MSQVEIINPPAILDRSTKQQSDMTESITAGKGEKVCVLRTHPQTTQWVYVGSPFRSGHQQGWVPTQTLGIAYGKD